MSWQDSWSFVRRWTWLLLLGVVLAASCGYVVSVQLPKVYEAKAKLLVAPGQLDGRLTDYGQLQGATLLTRTYADLVKTRRSLDRAAQATGMDPTNLVVDAAPQRDTQILEITVRADDPVQAATFANALAESFVREQQATEAGRFTASEDRLTNQVNQLSAAISERSGSVEVLRSQPPSSDRDVQLARLQGELASLQQSLATATRSLDDLRVSAARTSALVSVVDPATPSFTPVQPRILVNVVLAALAGLVASGGVAYFLTRQDNRILTPERLSALTGLNALGTVAPLSDGTLWALERSGQRSAKEDYKTAQVAEDFRLIWTYMRFMDEQRPIQVVLVTSSLVGEGKTSTAANLAVVAARAGQKVLLVDADLRRASLHEVFGTSNRVGLTNLLLERSLLIGAAIADSGVPGLSLLASGPTPPFPSALLASPLMCERIGELRALADLVIVDSPPTLAVSDPAVLANLVDGTLLVADAQTRVSELNAAMDTLEQAGAHLLGVVLNRVVSQRTHYYASYHRDAVTPVGPTPSNRRNNHSSSSREPEVSRVD